jgi:hypothetical protein
MKPASGQSDWFGERVNTIIGSIWSAEYQAIVDEIERLTKEGAARRPRKRLTVAARRMISDLRLLAAHKKRRPVAECEALYFDRIQLGFPTLADEATAVSAHARYCRQMGETAAATKYAAGVLKKIESSRGTAKPPIPAELEAVLRSMSGSV